jgi:fatty acid desaturase
MAEQGKESLMAGFQPLFRYSSRDALLALSTVGIVGLLFTTLLYFDTLSWWILGPAFVVIAWSYCWNLQCIAHNFIHNPFFRPPFLNQAFSVLNTLALGVPQIIYHHYHLNHHWGDNDAKGPDGTTRDWSSIYRHGKGDQPEAFWKYCLVSFFRVELGPVVRVVFRHGRGHVLLLLVETTVLAAFWITMALVNWRYLVLFYLPSYYLGWMLSYAEGYLEHFGCKPGNIFANSVSSYHTLYNLLWFNNGYHQEHHWDPKCHWTQMKELHERIKPQLEANGTRILRGPHLTGLIEDWLNKRHATSGTPAPMEESHRAAA